MYWEIFTGDTPEYGDVIYTALHSHSFMLACTTWIHDLFTYQNMCIMLKIPLLYLKSDFITLKSLEELAAQHLCARQLMQQISKSLGES